MQETPPAVTAKTCNNCSYQFKSRDDYLGHGSGWRVCTSSHLWFECTCGSTLLLRQGDYNWYSPSLFLSNAALKVLEQDPQALLKLPHLPSGLMMIQQAIRNSQNSSDDIAGILRKTPALAAEILKMANQVREGSTQILSLAHAVTYLGRSTVSYLALTASLQAFRFRTQKFSSEAFWQEAFLIGMISETLAKQFVRHLSNDWAYLAGALCNIGKLVAAICYPESTDKVVQILANPKTMTTWLTAEESQTSPNHLVLGDIAAYIWGLPKEIRQAILLHHRGLRPRKVMPQAAPELSIGECVGLSCLLAHWILLEPHRINEKQLHEYTSYLGWGEEKMEAFVKGIEHFKGQAEQQAKNSRLLH